MKILSIDQNYGSSPSTISFSALSGGRHGSWGLGKISLFFLMYAKEIPLAIAEVAIFSALMASLVRPS